MDPCGPDASWNGWCLIFGSSAYLGTLHLVRGGEISTPGFPLGFPPEIPHLYTAAIGPSRLLVQRSRYIRVGGREELRNVQVAIFLASAISLSLAQGPANYRGQILSAACFTMASELEMVVRFLRGTHTHTHTLKSLNYLLFGLLQKKFLDLFLAYLNTTGEEPGKSMSESWKTQDRERRYQWRKVPKQGGGDEQSIEGRISLKQEEGPPCCCGRMEEGTTGIDEGRKQGWVWMWMYCKGYHEVEVVSISWCLLSLWSRRQGLLPHVKGKVMRIEEGSEKL